MNRVRAWQLAVFLGALGATIIIQRQFESYSLQTEQTPHGIIDFEIARSAERAREIIAIWRNAGLLERVRPNIAVVDTRFIPCYTIALLAGCTWAAGAFTGRLSTLGRILAAAQILTAALDFGENAALLRAFDALTTEATANDPTIWPAIAALCAWPKLALVAAGGIYIIAGVIAYMRRLMR
jgi:hypothetical protein